MRMEAGVRVLRPPARAGSSPLARALGAACLGAAGFALLRAARGGRLAERRTTPAPTEPAWPSLVVPGLAGRRAGARGHRSGAGDSDRSAAEIASRSLHRAAAVLALSVLADSALEHYRGQFENPGMFAPLLVSLATLATAARANRTAPVPAANPLVYATALATGAAGAAFHAYNIWRRPGGFCWQNLFYAAPLGAPAALGLAGGFGLSARRVAASGAGQARVLGMSAGRALRALSAAALAGTAAEAGLLHFRGAFHHPAMWLPVTLPPVAAATLLRASRPREPLARFLLGATALLGFAGVAFHARGVARQMAGWRNWRQNLLSGPPLPAPPSFVALALAGRAALALGR